MILARYFSKIFVVRFLAVLLALSALVELLSMLDALRHLVGAHSSLKNVATFSALQLPLALEQLFLLAVLIGGALAFRALAQNNEMIVLRSSGMSPYRLIGGLLPLIVVLSAAYYVIVDRVAPQAERNFAEWWRTVATTDDDNDEPEAKGTIWLRAGGEIVSVVKVEDGGRRLLGVTRYLRDSAGMLSGRIKAETGYFSGKVWHLSGVEDMRLPGGTPVVGRFAALDWTDGPSAGNFEELALPTRRMQSEKGREVLAGAWAGAVGAAHYRTLVQKSYSAPFLPLLMMLMAMPALVGSGRRATIRGMAIGITMGLAFLVANGFLASMSEAGVLEPILAVWTAPIAFFAFAFAQLLRNEE